MSIGFRKASNRNTQAYEVTLGEQTFYISYSTVVGYHGPLGHCRRDNIWGPTTGRHMREMGISKWPIISDEHFEKLIEKATPKIKFTEAAMKNAAKLTTQA